MQNSKEYFEEWIKYLKQKNPKNSRGIVQDYKNKWYAPHMFRSTLCIHNAKKACFVRLRGCPYAPCIWIPHMFGCPRYVWMHLYVWVAPCMFRCPHMPPVCLDTHIFGCTYVFGCLPMFGCPLYAWTHSIGLDAPICLDASCT